MLHIGQRARRALIGLTALGVVLGVLGGGQGVASAQPGCQDLGWKQSQYHVYHGVRCGNHDTWDFFGPGGAYGGVAFHYWWPSTMTLFDAAQLPGDFKVRIRVSNAPTTRWDPTVQAPGFTHKLWNSLTGFNGDLQVVVSSIVNAGSQFNVNCQCNIATINTF